jgi:hypothetical protein
MTLTQRIERDDEAASKARESFHPSPEITARHNRAVARKDRELRRLSAGQIIEMHRQLGRQVEKLNRQIFILCCVAGRRISAE